MYIIEKKMEVSKIIANIFVLWAVRNQGVLNIFMFSSSSWFSFISLSQLIKDTKGRYLKIIELASAEGCWTDAE